MPFMSFVVVNDAKAEFDRLANEFSCRDIAFMPGGDCRYESDGPIPQKPMLGDGASTPIATLFAWLMLYRAIWQLQS